MGNSQRTAQEHESPIRMVEGFVRSKDIAGQSLLKSQVKLSLLIATNAQAGGQLQRERPNLCSCNQKRASVCDQDREYYSFVRASDTRTFFDAPFGTTLAVLER